MNFVDLKYSNILSTRLEHFKIKENNPFRANFRCPICGDSKKSKLKARGWILEKDNSAIYYCHNCGISLNLRNFLKSVDTNLYNEYVIDSHLEKNGVTKEKASVRPLDTLVQKQPNFKKKTSPLHKDIIKVSSLHHDHPCVAYVKSRKIPSYQQHRLYYAPKFNTWVNSILPDKLPNLEKDKPRLVMPFIDKNGDIFGFNARAFDKNELRYITIMLKEDSPKIFGLDKLNSTRSYYVVEGPLDSLFLNNSIAMAGADGNYSGIPNPENAVFVFDNEPRNKEIVKRMTKCLDNGFKVCIWPQKVLDKDINDMILSGSSPREVQDIINSNTHCGLQGKLNISFWRKC